MLLIMHLLLEGKFESSVDVNRKRGLWLAHQSRLLLYVICNEPLVALNLQEGHMTV